MNTPLRITHVYTTISIPRNRIESIAVEIYRGEKIDIGRLTDLVLCSDYAIRKLNAFYRGKDRPTDVLSFEFNDPDYLGEIYISLQRTKIQARRYKVKFENELHRLFVHGLLHLAGYDHTIGKDREIMEKRELKYLNKFLL